jgi:hypothetical protein
VALLLQVRPFDEVFSWIALLSVAIATAAVAGRLVDPKSFFSEKKKTNVKILPFLTRTAYSTL